MVNIYSLFSRFVRQEVIEADYINESSKAPGYNELLAEAINNRQWKSVINNIDCYICSISSQFVMDQLRNSKREVLFVEPGEVVISNNNTSQRVSIFVVAPYSRNNNNSINESLILSQTYETITFILDMLSKWEHNFSLPCGAMIRSQNAITPIPFEAMESHTGWQTYIDIITPKC